MATTCPLCEERYYGTYHTCDPAWEVWEQDEDRDEARVVHTFNAEDAATKACEEWDDNCGDGPSEREVWVCPRGSEDPEETESFSVCPEPQVVYYANASYETYNPQD